MSKIKIPGVSFSLNRALGNIPNRTVKVDAYLHYRLLTQCETLAVVFEVDLLHRRLRILVELQFQKIEVGLGQENDINPAIRCVHFYIYQIVCEEGEDDE